MGTYWNIKEDELYIKAELTKLSKKIKHNAKVIQVLVEGEKFISIKPHLTLRVSLSLHTKPFDLLGLVLSTRMIGSLPFRETLESFKKEWKTSKIPWDDKILGDLKDQWMEYFQMLAGLKDIKFSRSYKPEGTDPDIDPELCTLTDGNPNAMGTASYI